MGREGEDMSDSAYLELHIDFLADDDGSGEAPEILVEDMTTYRGADPLASVERQLEMALQAVRKKKASIF
jgi:hypothetical protein